jgi:hypothetical protein
LIDYDPKPRSRKGSGSERVCQNNLFGDLPRYAREIPKDWKAYYLMVAENGAAELSHCMVKNRTFKKRRQEKATADREGTR